MLLAVLLRKKKYRLLRFQSTGSWHFFFRNNTPTLKASKLPGKTAAENKNKVWQTAIFSAGSDTSSARKVFASSRLDTCHVRPSGCTPPRFRLYTIRPALWGLQALQELSPVGTRDEVGGWRYFTASWRAIPAPNVPCSASSVSTVDNNR